MEATYAEVIAAQDRHELTCPRCLWRGTTGGCKAARWLERLIDEQRAQTQKEAA